MDVSSFAIFGGRKISRSSSDKMSEWSISKSGGTRTVGTAVLVSTSLKIIK